MTPKMDEKKALVLGRRVLLQEAEVLKTIAQDLDFTFWNVVQLIVSCPGIIWTTGVGTSAAIAMRFSHILTDCGVRSMFLSPDQGLHGHTGVMVSGEVLIAMSRGGESSEVNQMVEIANRRALKTIAFVHALESSLAKSAHHVLPIHSPDAYEVGGYCATASTVAFSAVCDAISAVVLEMTGYDKDAFGQTHPGGAVGQTKISKDK